MTNIQEHLIERGSEIRAALEKLNKLGIDAILFVVDKNNCLIGSLTDGDVRRGLLRGVGVDGIVDEIIQPNPKYIRKGDRDIKRVIEYRENHYKIIPVINKDDEIVNIINFRHVKSYLPVDAVIMAGGRGERLRPLTDSIPKPLLKVGEKPILEHNLDRLCKFGIDDYWFTVKYLGNQIEDYFGDGSNKNIIIKYLYEDEPLGTIGAVSKIKDFSHDYVLVTNSDLLTNIDYEHFFLDFLKQGADFSVATIPYRVDIPYAVLETSNGHVVSFKEKPTYTYYSNGGIYLMKREILEFLPIAKQFNTTDLMEKLISLNKKVVSYPLEGYWLDIGKHEDYKKAQNDIKLLKLN
jgi:dTDP-glucose pyrophosphorylase